MTRTAQAFEMLVCYNFESRAVVKVPQSFRSSLHLIMSHKEDWARDKTRHESIISISRMITEPKNKYTRVGILILATPR